MNKILVTRKLPSSVLSKLEAVGDVDLYTGDTAMSADELRGLLGAVPTSWRPFFTLLAYTGIRLGEVVSKEGSPALRWGDVRLSERRLTVQSRTRRLKTSSSGRDVPIPFGPYLAGAGVLTLFFSQPLMALYGLG